MFRKLRLTFLALAIGIGISQAQLSTYNFSATTGGAAAFVPISGGTSPSFTALFPTFGIGAADEGIATNLPIGFSFRYLGTNYTTITMNSNGFAYFGTGTFTGTSEPWVNNLAAGITAGPTGVRPIIAPLWADMDMTNTSNMKYTTTGVAPGRVFTMEWLNAKWDYNAANAGMSFQVKLYETSNIIEFIYRQESGALSVPADGASIGLTATATGSGNFSSLNNSGATPTPSTTTETNNIITKPATGQIYRWDPTYCAAGGTSTSTIGEKIANVTFNTINNSSTSFAQYENFTNLVTSVTPGTTYSLSITLNANAYPPDETRVFIDYNGNGVFTDAGETVFTGAGPGPFSTNITIPLTAPFGLTRMRIRMHDTSDGPNGTSCGFAAWGQVEDYTINISACSAAAVGTQPANTTVCNGGNGTISLSAAGNGITYQWQVSTDGGTSYSDLTNAAPYGGVTTNTLAITGATTGLNNNRYRVSLGGTCTPANTFSNAATLTVNAAPVVTTNPANRSVCDGSSATFTAAGTGSSVTFQWQVSTNNGTSYSNLTNGTGVSGATTATLTLNPVSRAMDGRLYRCVLNVTSCTSAATTGARLTVFQLPTVSLGVAPFTRLQPGMITTVTATPTPAAATNVYTWFRNGVQINGASASTLSVDVDGQGSYTAFATDANGCTGPVSAAVVVADQASTKMWIYPNPNKGTFQVRYHSLNGNTLPRQINVFDARGARIETLTYTIASPYSRMDVDLTNHGKGVYMIELMDSNGRRIASERVVVQ